MRALDVTLERTQVVTHVRGPNGVVEPVMRDGREMRHIDRIEYMLRMGAERRAMLLALRIKEMRGR